MLSLLTTSVPGSTVFLARASPRGGFELDPMSVVVETASTIVSLVPPTLSLFTGNAPDDPPWELAIQRHLPFMPATNQRIFVMPIGPADAPTGLVGVVTPFDRAAVADPLTDAALLLSTWVALPGSPAPVNPDQPSRTLMPRADTTAPGTEVLRDPQRIFELLPEQVFVKDRDLRFQLVNEQLARDFGFTRPSEMIGLTDQQLFPPALATEFAAAERLLLTTGEPIIGALENQQLPGDTDRWRRTDKHPIRNEAGEIIGLLGSSWDVTAWRAAEQRLRPLAALVEWSNDAVIGIGLDERISYWNRGAEVLFGYTAEEIVGDTYRTIVPHGADMRLMRDLLSESPLVFSPPLETQRLRRDNTRVDVEVRAAAVRDEDEQPIGVSVILRDITERKVAEHRLRELERRYRTFIERMPAVSYIIPPAAAGSAGRYLYFSDRCESEFGYAVENWYLNPGFTFTIVHPDDRDRLQAESDRSDSSGQPFSTEYRIITATGAECWVRDESLLVHDDTGAAIYWLGFMVNISEQKQSEQVITQANEELRSANVELKRLSAVKSEIVSAISHEFRTPLTSIQGYSELLLDEALEPDEVHLFARTINTNARRLARMISDMLDLDRLDSGHVTFRVQAVDLNEIAENVADMLRPGAAQHAIVLELDQELPPARADADLVTQVLTNLVANAVKYSPAGGDILLRTAFEAGRDRVVFQVRDHGLGIPPAALNRIFDRYARLDRPEQASIEGTGLGLPIARQIMDMHGGSIWAESDPATPGSLFTVEFPVMLADNNATPDEVAGTASG